MKRTLIAANWKMHTTRTQAEFLAAGVRERIPSPCQAEVVLCPPFPYLQAVAQRLIGSEIALGAQNMYFETFGAFTGEVCAEMLTDLGCRYVIIGHSERRHVFAETDDMVNRKIGAARNAGLTPILCVGELLAQRTGANTEEVLQTQLLGGLEGVSEADCSGLVVAYEPVWAIGTGQTASPEQAQEAHAYLRKLLADRYNDELAGRTRILYGGSVKPENAADLLAMADVDGALVGGASLSAVSFAAIAAAAG